MVRVISIDKEKERILSFLYPTYHIGDGIRHCITHKNVKNKNDMEAHELLYEDCIFISSAWFDELWDDAKIKEETLRFARSVLKSRKSKIASLSDNVVDDCITFLFNSEDNCEDEERLSQLTHCIDNPLKFTDTYQRLVSIYGCDRVAYYMDYAIRSIMGKGTVYYNRLKSLMGRNIKTNIAVAVILANLRYDDMWGLNRCKMYLDIFKKR